MNKQHNLGWLIVAGLSLLPLLLSGQGDPCNTVENRVGTDEIFLTAEAGTSEAQLPVYPVTGPAITALSGTLDLSDAANTVDYRADNSLGAETPETCEAVITNTRYDVYTLMPESSGVLELRKPAGQSPQYSFSVFDGSFDPANGCATWLASSSTTGIPPSEPAESRTEVLVDVVGGQLYYVVVAAVEALANPPQSYTIDVATVSPPVYEGTPLAAANAYTYLATTDDLTTMEKNIVAQSPTADFRTLNAGDYEIFGVDYQTASVDPTTFPGQTLSGIQGGGNCLRISENSLLLAVSDAAAPVDWLDFRAVARDNGVELQWEVASERENDYFRVERSTDGTVWETLDEVAGNGTRDLYAAFQYLDESPAPGTNFYRLAQVDFDGTVDFSAVVTVTWEGRETGLLTFPNPFTNRLTVRSATDLPGQPRLFDLQGRDVSQQLRITVDGRQALLEVDSLPVGVYVIHWGKEQLRVVKN